MSLEQKSEVWLEEYSKKYPWVRNIIKEYGLDLPLYNLDRETTHSSWLEVNRANFTEDVHFLKAFDEYVTERLPANFSSVLDVGTGVWTYSFALATFFRRYKKGVPIVGIDKDPHDIQLAEDSIRNRKIQDVATYLSDIKDWSRCHDIIVCLSPNLMTSEILQHIAEFTPTRDFFYHFDQSEEK